MLKRNWLLFLGSFALTLSLALSNASPARAEDALLKLKNHTEVKLAFDDEVNSKTAKPGDVVHLHVTEPVKIEDKTVIAAGTPVIGAVSKVNHRARFGVNAKIQMVLSPLKTTAGTEIPLGFKTKTNDMSRAGTAAGASVGGAVVLGPVGLVGGYFVMGKNVHCRPGDKLSVEVSKDTLVKSVL